MRRPVNEPYSISTEFGVKDSSARYGRHAGVDYAIPSGREVFAPVSGIVTDYTWGEYHGNVVQILADDNKKYHRLMHNSRLLVKPGDHVHEGQLVARSGATGKGVTGPHVHWDISPEKIPSSFNFLSPADLLFSKQPETKSNTGYRLYFDPIGQVATFYPIKGGTFSMKIKDPSYNWNVLKNEGNRVLVNSASAGGDCWVYLKYTATGNLIPGRYIK